MTPRACAGLALLAAAAGLTGCGGDGVLDPTGGVVPPSGATFTEIQGTIFTPRCAFPGCHGGASPAQGLNLEPGRSHGNLVGVPSTEVPQFLRVEPGNAADSYLLMKLAGDPRIAGARMPFGGPFLTADQILLVAEWIDAGAADN